MKIEANKLKVVQISTGSVIEPSHVRTFIPYRSTQVVRDLANLEAQVEQAEDALHALYAGPKPAAEPQP